MRARKPLEQRLLNHLAKSGECWVWTARRDDAGYGKIWDGCTMTLAHRVAYRVFCAPIPAGLKVLHRCDNPPCCNPAHLFLGTQQDNMDDMVAKGRSSKKLDDEDMRRIAQLQSKEIPQVEIARELGVSNITICRHAAVGGPKGARNASAKLTADQVREARRRIASGEPIASVARSLGVQSPAVWKIVHGYSWKHI